MSLLNKNEKSAGDVVNETAEKISTEDVKISFDTDALDAGTDAADPAEEAAGNAQEAAETAAGTAEAAIEAEEKPEEEPEEASEETKKEKTKKEKPKKAKKPAAPSDQKSLKNGSYFLGITAIAIVAIIVINMIVGAIPSKFRSFDITDNKLYSIGDTTKGVLEKLDKDVTLYYLVKTGSEDETISKLLDSYASASSHVSVVKKDIVANPTFAQKYTSDEISENSVIAVCGDKSKYVANGDIYPSDYSDYYSMQSSSSTTFDGEGQITTAIANVTSDKTTKLYYTTGHSELSMSSNMTSLMSKANITVSELNLLSTDIPDDCSTLMIFSPTADFTSEEAQKVIKYLQGGGHAMIVTVASKTDMPNLDSIVKTWGITRVAGYVLDKDTAHYTQSPVLLMPDKMTGTNVSDGISDLNLVYAFAQGLKVGDTPADAKYTVTTLLKSSDNSYSISFDNTSGEKEDGDASGPFPLAVSISDTTSGMKLLYYTTPCVFSEDALTSLLQQTVSLPEGNTKLLTNSLTYLTDATQTISVDSKSTEIPYNTVDARTGLIVQGVFMVVLPIAAFAIGLVIWLKRRNR